MTSIGPTSYFAVMNRTAAPERSPSNTGFADRLGQAAASTTQPPSDKLSALKAELEQLKSRQAGMSNRDYRFANFTLLEKIATERLNAGEDLDVIGVQFEGRVFKVAGTLISMESLQPTKIPDVELAKLQKLDTSQRGYAAPRPTGVDILV